MCGFKCWGPPNHFFSISGNPTPCFCIIPLDHPTPPISMFFPPTKSEIVRAIQQPQKCNLKTWYMTSLWSKVPPSFPLPAKSYPQISGADYYILRVLVWGFLVQMININFYETWPHKQTHSWLLDWSFTLKKRRRKKETWNKTDIDNSTHLLLGCLGFCRDGMSKLSVDKLS